MKNKLQKEAVSVSRTFGDAEAKMDFKGGNMNVVKAEPEIVQF